MLSGRGQCAFIRSPSITMGEGRGKLTLGVHVFQGPWQLAQWCRDGTSIRKSWPSWTDAVRRSRRSGQGSGESRRELSGLHLGSRSGRRHCMVIGHPDREFVAYLVEGMRSGFRIGFNRGLVRLKSAKRNMKLAAEEPAVIDAYLAKEVAAKRIRSRHRKQWWCTYQPVWGHPKAWEVEAHSGPIPP